MVGNNDSFEIEYAPLSARYSLPDPVNPLGFLHRSFERRYLNSLRKDIYKRRLKYRFSKCVCGNKGFRIISKFGRYNIPTFIAVCSKCCLVQQNPRMDKDSSKYFYKKYFNIIFQRGSTEKKMVNLHHGERIYEFVKDYLSLNTDLTTILEIGCSYGDNLIFFNNIGFNVIGVDYDVTALEFAKNYLGLKNIYFGSIEV